MPLKILTDHIPNSKYIIMIKSFVEVQPSRKKILFSIKKMYRNTQVVGDCFFPCIPWPLRKISEREQKSKKDIKSY